MAFGMLLGGHAWDVPAERLLPALAVTVASGAALMAIELQKGVRGRRDSAPSGAGRSAGP